jgi:hypothetical protein
VRVDATVELGAAAAALWAIRTRLASTADVETAAGAAAGAAVPAAAAASGSASSSSSAGPLALLAVPTEQLDKSTYADLMNALREDAPELAVVPSHLLKSSTIKTPCMTLNHTRRGRPSLFYKAGVSGETAGSARLFDPVTGEQLVVEVDVLIALASQTQALGAGAGAVGRAVREATFVILDTSGSMLTRAFEPGSEAAGLQRILAGASAAPPPLAAAPVAAALSVVAGPGELSRLVAAQVSAASATSRSRAAIRARPRSRARLPLSRAGLLPLLRQQELSL